MTDHEAFLAAIIAEPDDDAPRLIYADFLEERGDPHGEFIRVQIAVEQRRRGPAGPVSDESPWLQGDGVYQALRRRERELEACDFTREEVVFGGRSDQYERHWQFRRGFVEAVTMTADDWLAHGDEIRKRQPIRDVTLTTWPEKRWVSQWVPVGAGQWATDAWRRACQVALRCAFGKDIAFHLPPASEYDRMRAGLQALADDVTRSLGIPPDLTGDPHP